MSFSMRLPTPWWGEDMDMTTYGNVCVGRSEPNQKDVILLKTIKGKYKLINKDTGKVYRYYHRRPKNKDWSTRWLIGKKAETKGKLAVVPNI